MADFTNADGLTRHYGPQDVRNKAFQVVNMPGGAKQLVVDFAYNDLPSFDADAGGGSTPDSFSDAIPFIPAGSFIKSAYLVTVTDWATADSAVLDIGTYTQAGSAIDADGIFDGVAAASLDVGDVVKANGVDVVETTGTFDGGVVSTTEKAYIRVQQLVGSFTTGKSRLIVEYVPGVAA